VVLGAIGRAALVLGLIPASRGRRILGGCRRSLAINMITSARARRKASATTRGAGSASATSTCPMPGPASALLKAHGLQASGEEGIHRERDDQR